ncbi:MAG: TAXI family TRAP transporter solute-binding subunit [Rhizobiaceae bacterium]
MNLIGMKRMLTLTRQLIEAALVVFLVCASSAAAQEFEKNIVTGGPKGTYIQIGRDLSEIEAQCGLNLNVIESAGSLENLVAVKNRLFTQFGIVQSDVLDYVRTYSANDQDLQRSLWGVRIMFPLYNEEIHVLARSDINSITELAGRKVAIGAKDSGTFLTATLVLDIMRVKNAERLPVSSGDALPKLLSGEIDALFYVAGAPASLFSDKTIDGGKFHLLDLDEPPLRATYTHAQISGGTYPFQPDAVNTVAVKAVLMTFDYTPSKSGYHLESCKAASDLSWLILNNLDRLRETGHPKWKDVDLSALPPGWKVSDCVKAGMASSYQLACGPRISSPIAGNNADTDQEYLNLLKQRLNQ